MPSSRRVAVIGAAGQLGTDLVAALRGTGAYHVTPWPHEHVDVTRREQIDAAMEETRPDIVVNCAAFHQVDECEDRVAEALRINGHGASEVARACRQAGALCVFFSTDYVFWGDKGDAYTEDDVPRPINAYGVSKVAGELLVREATDRHLIVRISSVFGRAGARGKGGNFVESILKRARAGDALRVVADQVMSPTYTVDAAETVRALLDADATGLYHAANAGACSWCEFAQAAVRLAGLRAIVQPIASAEYPSRARRPSNSSLRSVRLPAGLGSRPWELALSDYLQAKGHIHPDQGPTPQMVIP